MSWEINDIHTPIEEPQNIDVSARLPRLTRQQIINKYGQPDLAYQQKYCLVWYIKHDFDWFPASKIFINHDFMNQLSKAFIELEKNNLQSEIKTFDGCFEVRATRGTNLISLHSYAMAIDLNAAENKLGQVVPAWSNDFLNIMRKYVYCGSDFIGRRDPMHFSLLGE